MHFAYKPQLVLEKLPLQVESISAYEPQSDGRIHLFIGTKDCRLLMYEVIPDVNTSQKSFSDVKVQLLRSNKYSVKKPPTQLAIVPEYQILIVLSDNVVTVHDIAYVTTPLLATLESTRGATLFTVDVKLKGEKTDLTSTAGPRDPKVIRISGDTVALSRDKDLVFVEINGLQPSFKRIIKWSDAPIAVEFDLPYLVGLLTNCIEVLSPSPHQLIQEVDLQGRLPHGANPHLMCYCSQGRLFVASSTHVWLLEAQPVSTQIETLLKQRHFELALKLTGLVEEGEDQNKLIQYIKSLHGPASPSFLADPSHVIGLFPDLLPQYFRSQLEYPDKLPELEGMELDNGLVALRDYLTQMRTNLLAQERKKIPSRPILEGNNTIGNKERLLQIIDTTMVKCYLQMDDSLVGVFLNLKNNHCHLEETERALKSFGKYSELIILYKNKGQHRKALELLRRQGGKPDSPLYDHQHTVLYLQQLGNEHADLVLEFCTWVLERYPEEGLKIFTESQAEDPLPRGKVMMELQKKAPSLVLPYLEYMIHEEEDKTPILHDTLIEKYEQCIQELTTSSSGSVNELCGVRFHEERAVLFERLGQHSKALATYVHLLHDWDRALAYCEKIYDAQDPVASQVFVDLLRLCLLPPETGTFILRSSDQYGSSYQESSHEGPKFPLSSVDLERALLILNQHASKLDAVKILEMFPDDVPLESVSNFLKENYLGLIRHKQSWQILHALRIAQDLQVEKIRLQVEGQRVLLNDQTPCSLCSKKFGKQRKLGDMEYYYTECTCHEQISTLLLSHYSYLVELANYRRSNFWREKVWVVGLAADLTEEWRRSHPLPDTSHLQETSHGPGQGGIVLPNLTDQKEHDGDIFPYEVHVSNIETIPGEHWIPTTFRAVFDNAEQENFVEHLEGHVRSRSHELTDLCNAHYRDFIKSVGELQKLGSVANELRKETTCTNNEVKAAVGDLTSKTEELTEALRLHKNISLTIESLSACLPVLETYSQFQSFLKKKEYFYALKSLDSLERIFLPNLPKYNFCVNMKESIPALKKSIKEAALEDLNEYLENVRKITSRVGKWALDQVARDLGFLEPIPSDEDIADVDAQELVDYSPVYRCVHIYSLMKCQDELIRYYRNERKKQVQLVLEVPINMHASVDAFEQYCYGLVGFFVIENCISNTTDAIMAKAHLDNLWETALPRAISAIRNNSSLCTDLSLMLRIKELVIIVTHTLSNYSYNVERLFDLYGDLRDHYTEILMQRWVSIFGSIFDEDDYQPYDPETHEFPNLMETFNFSEENLVNGRLIPFSHMVPKVYSQVQSFVDESLRFSQDLGLSHKEVRDSVRKATQLLLSRTLSGCLCDLLKKPNLGFTQLIQIFINMNYLEEANCSLERYISEVTGTMEEMGSLSGKGMFRDARTEAEQQIYIQLRYKIDESIELCEYDWMLEEAKGRASDNILDLVAFLENTFRSFTNLPLEVAQSACLHACQHIGQQLLSILLDKNIKQMTNAALTQFNMDVVQCEMFACSAPVRDIDQMALLMCFADLRQLLDLFLSWDWSTYFHGLGKENSKYLRVSPSVSLMMLERIKAAESRPIFSNLKRSERDRKKLMDAVHKQLKQLCTGAAGDTAEMQSTEELDYIVQQDVRPGLLSQSHKRSHELLKKKSEDRAKQKEQNKPKHIVEAEKREEGLQKAISSDNKGFALLQKMGYKPGTSLGKQEDPVERWYWPSEHWKVLQGPTEDESDDEDEDDVEEEDEPSAEDKLEMLTVYLRTKYFYCVWCGTRYEDKRDLQDQCPGLTKAKLQRPPETRRFVRDIPVYYGCFQNPIGSTSGLIISVIGYITGNGNVP
ncbi:unnamed protein product, partial [Darwinula stevensoni]